MTRKFFILTLSLLITISMVLTACTPEETSTPTAATPGTSTATPTSTETGGGNWWDKFGEPEYGGEIIWHVTSLSASDFDPANLMMHSPYGYWLESLFSYDWALDRDIYTYKTGFVSEEYWTGWLAESWDWSGPTTVTVKLREGIHYQNKEPVNGREFVAQDVQYTFDRILGTGSGFTEPLVFWTGMLANLDRVVAIDDYTVEFRLKSPAATGMILVIQAASQAAVVPHEWVEQGDLSGWEPLCGTGPWIASAYTQDVSLICQRNPDYWGFDARHPENQIPYADTIKEVCIPDSATALAALRTGQVDVLPGGRGSISWQQATSISDSDPDIVQDSLPGNGYDFELRCDTEPFTDINVRKALQMAIDRPLIAETYYNGTASGIPCGIAHPEGFAGWITPYEDWPQELKDEYSYDPEKSQELLAAAGYPDGFATNCVTSSSYDTQLLEIIKAQFEDIGVSMEIITMDDASFRAYGADLAHDQMIVSVNCGMFFIPSDVVRWRHSSNTRDNWTLNNDPNYDALVDQFNAATEIEEAKAIFNEADMYLLQQHWSVQVFPLTNPVLWQPYLKGYSGEFTASGSERGFYGARMWVDQELKESMGR